MNLAIQRSAKQTSQTSQEPTPSLSIKPKRIRKPSSKVVDQPPTTEGIQPTPIIETPTVDERPVASELLKEIKPITPNKHDQIIALLKRPDGAKLSELITATHWQAHSLRGMISGVLRKRLKLIIKSDKSDGERRYWIEEPLQ